MCMTKYVVLRTMLGAREIGWELWNKDKGEVVEMTSKEIMNGLSKGDPIYGLAIGENGELVLDKKFFMVNMMEHRHVNNYTPMVEDENCVANVAYIVTGKSDMGYKMVSTKWQCQTVTENMLKMFMSMGLVFGGAKLEGDKVVLPDLAGETKKEEEKPTEPKADAKKEDKKPTELKADTKKEDKKQ